MGGFSVGGFFRRYNISNSNIPTVDTKVYIRGYDLLRVSVPSQGYGISLDLRFPPKKSTKTKLQFGSPKKIGALMGGLHVSVKRRFLIHLFGVVTFSQGCQSRSFCWGCFFPRPRDQSTVMKKKVTKNHRGGELGCPKKLVNG